MGYRAEIDGLRAIAVIPVILFHAGFPLFSGGFVGVDVFFVISGYLITGILLKELNADGIRLSHFWIRRVRRILPALFLVVFATMPFAWAYLFPDDLRSYGDSLMAVAVMVSNFLFSIEADYFAEVSEAKPLLHTWSLAVEEQFYAFYPLGLLLLAKINKRLILPAIIAAFFLSLGLAEWGVRNSPTKAFYWLPTRGWELLLGAMAAFYFGSPHHQNLSKVLKQALGILGVILICIAIFIYEKGTPFPGLYALVPTLGTALFILFATEGMFVQRIVRNPVFVGIGKISYSAYLWHMPILVFAAHRSLTEPNTAMKCALIGLTFGLSYLSWRFVETPFREKRVSTKTVFSTIVIAMIITIGAGFTLRTSDGFDDRYTPDVLNIHNTATQQMMRAFKGCETRKTIADETLCSFGASTPASFAIVGDSHARSLVEALDSAAKQHQIAFRQFTKNGCPASAYIDHTSYKGCPEFMRETLRLIADNDISTVILASRWAAYPAMGHYDNLIGGAARGINKPFIAINENASQSSTDADALHASYTRMIEALLAMNKRVVIVLQMPEHGWNVPHYLAKQKHYNNRSFETLSVPLRAHEEYSRTVNDTLAKFQTHPDVLVFDPASMLCSTEQQQCFSVRGGQILYFDDDHPSPVGAQMLVQNIFQKYYEKWPE